MVKKIILFHGLFFESIFAIKNVETGDTIKNINKHNSNFMIIKKLCDRNIAPIKKQTMLPDSIKLTNCIFVALSIENKNRH